MTIEFTREPITALLEYARVPIAFTVDRVVFVRACRFYERQGCQLRAIDRAAYAELPDEIQLFWYKDLPH